MFRWLLALVVLIALAAAGAYVVAGRGAPPQITIEKPDRVVGQSGALEVTADRTERGLTALAMTLEQNGRTVPALLARRRADGDHHARRPRHAARVAPARQAKRPRAAVRQSAHRRDRDAPRVPQPADADGHARRRIRRAAGAAADRRPVDEALRQSRRIGNGRLPGDAGRRRVGRARRRRGIPRVSGRRRGSAGGDPSLKVAFFALLHDQDPNTPIAAFARDEAGNEAKASFVDNVFPKPFKQSRIELDDRFINRVVPEILEHSPELKVPPPAESSRDAGGVPPRSTASCAGSTRSRSRRSRRRPRRNGCGTDRSSSSATHRWKPALPITGPTSTRARRSIGRSHLGFDLAVTAHVPVAAANSGTVLNASWLGIYGNCVIIDHGMGVAVAVRPPDVVRRQGGRYGRRGARRSDAADSTGLAGGDHLHFTMLVGGRMVNPVEWWDPHWIADRVERKLEEKQGRIGQLFCSWYALLLFRRGQCVLRNAWVSLAGVALAVNMVACGGGARKRRARRRNPVGRRRAGGAEGRYRDGGRREGCRQRSTASRRRTWRSR